MTKDIMNSEKLMHFGGKKNNEKIWKLQLREFPENIG